VNPQHALQMQYCSQEVMLSLQEQVYLHLRIISFSPWSDLYNVCIQGTSELHFGAQDRAHLEYA